MFRWKPSISHPHCPPCTSSVSPTTGWSKKPLSIRAHGIPYYRSIITKSIMNTCLFVHSSSGLWCAYISSVFPRFLHLPSLPRCPRHVSRSLALQVDRRWSSSWGATQMLWRKAFRKWRPGIEAQPCTKPAGALLVAFCW